MHTPHLEEAVSKERAHPTVSTSTPQVSTPSSSSRFDPAYGNAAGQDLLAQANAAPSLSQIRKGEAVIEQQMQGSSVEHVQAALTRLGFGVQVTGLLGSTTVGALQSFQRLYRVQDTGIVGSTTLAALDSAIRCSVTLDELKAVSANISDADAREWLPHLNASMAFADISSDARKAAYLAQLAHETDGFRTFEEYASGSAYEGRSDLGNTQYGDGRRFKGRGAIQLTGRANYAAASSRLGVDLVSNPELAASPEYAFLVSADYWKVHNLNSLADRGNFEGITDVINYYDPESRRQSRRRYHSSIRQTLSSGSDPTQIDQLSIPSSSGAVADHSPLNEVSELILSGQMADARQTASRLATDLRQGGGSSSTTDALGKLWQIADALEDTQAAIATEDSETAKERAHDAAEVARALRGDAALATTDLDRIIQAAGGWWSRADTLSDRG